MDRVEGYLAALTKADLPHDRSLIAFGDRTTRSGRAAIRALLQRTGFDAVFTGDDAMASGAIGALQAAGMTVPRDVSAVGFDDSGLSEPLEPESTTVRRPFALIGREMARLVCEPEPPPVPPTPPTELIVRASSRVGRPVVVSADRGDEGVDEGAHFGFDVDGVGVEQPLQLQPVDERDDHRRQALRCGDG